MGAALKLLDGQFAEPTLDQVRPRRAGGVEVRDQAGWAASHRLLAGVLCVEALSNTTCTSYSAGTAASNLTRIFLIDRPVPGVQRPDHQTGGQPLRQCHVRGK